jgi:uncharacterized protein (TIGR02145 family)
MKKLFIVTICFFALVTLNGQIVQERLPGAEEISNRRSPFNLEELKVRWKKAALENCPGVPCITVTVPGPPTSVTASAGNASASVSFVAPTNNGGSAITGYTVTSSPGGITATGATSPINVTGLTNGTAYTFRVIATNVIGNSVASSASTAVTPVAPNTVPGPPTSVVATAGKASASVAFVAPTNNGGSAITGYTVTSSPGGITATGTTSPINVTGLTNGTAYTFNVVATNAIGNSSPSTASSAVTPSAPFPCGTATVADIDGNTYNTVLIGSQCWTKENLKVTKYNDGNAIPLNNTYTSGTVSTVWQGLTTGAYTIYDNESSTGANATNYGYLYNWYAAKGIATAGSTTYKNICPTGWHVPTDTEWTTLTTYLGGTSVAGGKMKSTSSLWNSPNTGANNSSGFTALPGGFRNSDGGFFNVGGFAFFWSATEGDNSNAWRRSLSRLNGSVDRYNYLKSVGASVRCLRD